MKKLICFGTALALALALFVFPLAAQGTKNAQAQKYFESGLAYQEKEDYDRSIAELTQAIKLDPNFAEAYMRRGASYLAKGEVDRVIVDSTQAIKLKPNYGEAYYLRSMAYEIKFQLTGQADFLNQASEDLTTATMLFAQYPQ